MSTPVQPLAPRGWYTDPTNAGVLRYWDGAQWTNHTAPEGTIPAGPNSASAPIVNPSNAWHGTGSTNDKLLPSYYQDVFAAFDRGESHSRWNWAAFCFGVFWYFAKGLWVKGAILLALAVVTGGLAALFIWFYAGFMGNYDLYLLHRRGKNLW